MKRKTCFWLWGVLLLIFSPPPLLLAQQLAEMQFTNQPITDILLALGEISGKSVIPDETVRGNASYYFSETDFETALQVFLNTYKMYYRKEDNIYYVSRIWTEYDSASSTISMDAEDVNILYLVRAASKAIGKTILFDPLPAEPLTVHVTRIGPEKLLDIIIKRFTDYKVETDQDYYYIKRIAAAREDTPGGARPGLAAGISREGERYSIKLEKGRFREVVDELFLKADREYSLLVRKDAILEKLRFEGKDFEQMLRLILEQANADYSRAGEIYYIFEIQQRDVLKKLKTTIRIPLKFLSAKGLTNLFPSDLLSSRLFKIDDGNNSIILSGSLEEIAPIQEFIRQIDQPVRNQRYYRFDLDYLEAAKIKSLFPPAFRYLEPIVVPNTNSFVILLSPGRKAILEDYLKLADQGAEATVVKLRYIKAEELIKKLPPSIAKEEIVETTDPSIVFVKASQEKLEDFYRQLDILDRPVPQLRYHVLVIQYNEGESLDWTDSVDSSLKEAGSKTAFLGTIGQLLSLNFDIVSTFGYQFAVKLNLKLNTKRARILADTTLIGLSDQEISFQNTETFRYRELEVDEDGKIKPTGVTREITSGLIFKVKGWVSGDDMISMDINATVSKRGADVSGTTGNPPTTSENIVNTHLRTFSGEPMVIGGLIRQEKNEQVSKVPILGDIPLFGYFFQGRLESVENTELVIYTVPHVDFTEVEEADVGLRLEGIYQRFFAPLLLKYE